MFWAFFLWPNFQLLPYISILPWSSEKFSDSSMFLTSMFNISFIHGLRPNLAVTPLQSSHVEAELSYHKCLRAQRFSHICFVRALPSLFVLSCRHPQTSRSPVSIPWNLIPRQPASSTTNPAVILDDFNVHVDGSFWNRFLISSSPKTFSTFATHFNGNNLGYFLRRIQPLKS